MNVAVLTTQTLHHCHFVRSLSAFYPPVLVLCERSGAHPSFETRHPFEDERETYERHLWFGGADVRLDQFAPTIEIDSANDPSSIELLRCARPDVVVVFGTGRLEPRVIEVCPEGIVNLHGGDPEVYRGLDSHLWAIHDGAFDALVTTLHRVNARLDDGEVIARRDVPLTRGMQLHELRSRNTEVCVDLVRGALERFRHRGRFQSRPQARRGRYRSFMPAALKEPCRVRFAHHTEVLP